MVNDSVVVVFDGERAVANAGDVRLQAVLTGDGVHDLVVGQRVERKQVGPKVLGR